MATIEELNNNYTKENDFLKKLNEPGGLKDKIAQFEESLALYAKDFAVKDAEMKYAESRNDKATADALKADLEVISKNIFDMRNKLNKAQDFLTNQQKKVDEKFADLSKDPEIKKKLDSILYKKYDRKKEEELNKKQQLETIKQIIDAHPTIQNHLKGMENYKNAVKTYEGIINKFTKNPPTDKKGKDELAKAQKELPKSKALLDARRSDFLDFFAKTHPEVNQKLLLDIHSYLNLEKQIAGCDKSIANYNKAMDNLAMEYSEPSKPTEHSEPTEPFETNPLSPTLSEEKPSWLHPIKRLKYLINERKLRNAPEPEPEPEPEPKKSPFLDNVKLSKEEYNSEIVQKYITEKFNKNLHEAANQKESDPNVR